MPPIGIGEHQNFKFLGELLDRRAQIVHFLAAPRRFSCNQHMGLHPCIRGDPLRQTRPRKSRGIRAGARPLLANEEFLQGFRESVAVGLANIVGSIRTTLIFFFLLVLLRVLVKNRWVAAVIFALLFTVPKVLGSDHLLIETPVWLIVYAIAAFTVVPFGLIVLAMGVLTVDVLLNVPMTLDFSYWYAARAAQRGSWFRADCRLGVLHFTRRPAALEGRSLRIAQIPSLLSGGLARLALAPRPDRRAKWVVRLADSSLGEHNSSLFA